MSKCGWLREMLVIVVLYMLACHCRASIQDGQRLSPVLIMPGYGGSKLEARWQPEYVTNKTDNVHQCKRFTEWNTIWLAFKYALPARQKCLIDMLELDYNLDTRTTHNRPGLEIRIKEPEKLACIEYLTEHKFLGYDLFMTITEKLVKELGYERNANLRAAPYDWRKASNELGDYYDEVRNLTELMYAQSQDTRVTILCHSLGCLHSLYFLQNQSQEWKNKHIRRLVSLAAPWGGSLVVLRFIELGFKMAGLDIAASLGHAARTFPSTYMLFPHEKVFKDRPLLMVSERQKVMTKQGHGNNETLVPEQTITKNEMLSSKDYDRYFEIINYKRGSDHYENIRDLLNDLKAPGVEVQCFYGHGESTLDRWHMIVDTDRSSDGKRKKFVEKWHFEDGDETVTLASSTYCKEWQHEQGPEFPVHARGYRVRHIGMVDNPQVLEGLVEVLRVD